MLIIMCDDEKCAFLFNVSNTYRISDSMNVGNKIFINFLLMQPSRSPHDFLKMVLK
jgi:hypothetical protein